MDSAKRLSHGLSQKVKSPSDVNKNINDNKIKKDNNIALSVTAKTYKPELHSVTCCASYFARQTEQSYTDMQYTNEQVIHETKQHFL